VHACDAMLEPMAGERYTVTVTLSRQERQALDRYGRELM